MTALNNPKNWFIIVLIACLLLAMLLVIKHHNAVVMQTADITGNVKGNRFQNQSV